jgi:hypothetical protein
VKEITISQAPLESAPTHLDVDAQPDLAEADNPDVN